MMNPLEAAIASARHHLQLTALPVGPELDAEEGLRRRPRGGDGGGDRSRETPKGSRVCARPTDGVPAFGLSSGRRASELGVGPAAKSRLAAGAQPAVVKVASFAGGRRG